MQERIWNYLIKLGRLGNCRHYCNNILERPNCYTIAYWSKGSEGYDLQFVGNRPFDVDEKLFMELAKYGQLILDSYFNLEMKWELTE